MRLLIPFVFIALLVHVSASAQNSTNQESAEKIADAIGVHFPDAAIDVAYKEGQVWLKGETASPEQRKKIVDMVFRSPNVKVDQVSDEIQVVAPQIIAVTPAPVQKPAPALKIVASTMPASAMPASAVQPAETAVTAPVPVPKVSVPASQKAQHVPVTALPYPNTAPLSAAQPQPTRQRRFGGAVVVPYPYTQYQAAYGLAPGQPSAVPAPYAPPVQAGPTQSAESAAVQAAMQPQAVPQQIAPQYAHPHAQQPVYYGPPAQAAHHPEAYGPQGPLPGRYNQPNLPQHAWPAYANYPNYAQVSYPRTYSPKAWPYIGPFYPYPQTPLGWRKVTLENHNGWWWLDFDDGTPSGPFSGLFRQPLQYTY